MSLAEKSHPPKKRCSGPGGSASRRRPCDEGDDRPNTRPVIGGRTEALDGVGAAMPRRSCRGIGASSGSVVVRNASDIIWFSVVSALVLMVAFGVFFVLSFLVLTSAGAVEPGKTASTIGTIAASTTVILIVWLRGLRLQVRLHERLSIRRDNG